MEEKKFRNNWEKTYRENQKIDDLTDARIRAGIERKLSSGKSYRKYYWAAAAVILIGMLTIVYRPSSASEEAVKTQYYSSADYTRSISLPDGSRIVLEPHSILTLSSDFGKEDRKISFTGKATFDIAKDKARPFRINARDFEVQVLGTKFFLDQTAGSQKVELFEGKVMISHQGKTTYLLPNESWNQKSENTKQTYYAADSRRDFSFEDDSFGTIISELEQVYHIKIRYPKAYETKKIRGSFSGNLDEVLSAVCYPFNLKTVKVSDQEIELQ
ncbi:MAG: FecR family protein [Chryseobacterium sp.]|jgi:ferric-dicitrate binding protein FerR (iron transport regulator)|uniref:FecR family protein n=1 Tax=Chryseobacterium sp. TaxID=1871047 RepID=UPI00281854FF|nr:FecR family protein [Chryseobacterium sp.]MDR2236448.1 FecR family protein [Chryseobacterium sp.]